MGAFFNTVGSTELRIPPCPYRVRIFKIRLIRPLLSRTADTEIPCTLLPVSSASTIRNPYLILIVALFIGRKRISPYGYSYNVLGRLKNDCGGF